MVKLFEKSQLGGWVDGCMGGGSSRFKDHLQQSKTKTKNQLQI